jgi:hypothetical protein
MIENLSDWPELGLEMISGLKIEPNILGLRENCRVERILNLKIIINFLFQKISFKFLSTKKRTQN